MGGAISTCNNCGSQIPAGVRFCPECGRIMSEGAGSGSGAVTPGGGSERAGADRGRVRGGLGEAGGSSRSGPLGDETREIPETQFPTPYAEGGLGGAPTQYSPPPSSPPPPRYDDRPQYTPPPPMYGQGQPQGAYNPYAPPAPGSLPVPMAYGQTAIGFQCPFCRATMPPLTRERVSQTGWIVLVILLLFCFPLFWIGLLIKEPYRVCSQCGNTLS